MKRFTDLAAYLYLRYPNPRELSLPRLFKLIYLADWKYAIDKGQRLTNLDWTYNHYGPAITEVNSDLERDDRFALEKFTTLDGKVGQVVRLKDNVPEPNSLSDEEKSILDYVVRESHKLDWADFIRLIYSTYPIESQARDTKLDLLQLASEYNLQRHVSKAVSQRSTQ